MEIGKLKEIMQEFDKSSANSLKVKIDGMEVELKKGSNTPATTVLQEVVQPQALVQEVVNVVEPVNNFEKVVSPLVGLYYASKEEGAKPFITVGQKVNAGDTLFLVEAMKVFNEIKSPCTGVVMSINAINGEAVEFDQVIVEIDVNV